MFPQDTQNTNDPKILGTILVSSAQHSIIFTLAFAHAENVELTINNIQQECQERHVILHACRGGPSNMNT